jgi:hypothetical protein
MWFFILNKIIKLNKKSIMMIFLCVIILALLWVAYSKNIFRSQIEGLESNHSDLLNNMGYNTNISGDNAHNFCVVNQSTGSALNGSCGKLTKSNCEATDCCIWNNNRCVAGNKKDGPLFPNN